MAELLDGVDFGEQCRRLTEKRFPEKPETPAERQKRFAALTRYGYTPDEIRASGRPTGLTGTQIFPMISAIDVGKPGVSAFLNSQAMNPVATLRPMCRKVAILYILADDSAGLTANAAELPLSCR